MSAFDTELIEFRTAESMAAVYRTSVARLQELIVEIGEESRKLQEAFGERYSFDVDVYFDGSHKDANKETAEEVAGVMKRAAWGGLINKLGIRKVMSSKRQHELDEAISGRRNRNSYGGEPIQELPEITEQTIMEVLLGMCQSAEEFLGEAIREEYDFFKPSKHFADYKRNSEFTLNRKIIRPWMVERQWGGGWRPMYQQESHLSALDNIFHMLDGQGFPKGYRGPLCDSIWASQDGKFETDYFVGQCYKNGNLHLEFKRADLLEKFNQIAGRNRLPSVEAVA